MKNSRKSQIAVLIVLVISLVLSLLYPLFNTYHLFKVQNFLAYGLFVIAICAIIYYVVFSEKKIISIAISIVAIAIDMVCITYKVMRMFPFANDVWKAFLWANNDIRYHVYLGRMFFALLTIFAALLVTFIKNNKAMKFTKPQEPKSNYAQPDTTVSSEIYCSLIKHILLLLFTFGIWYYIWIYRMTGYTNAARGEEYRNPTKKLLLCMFVPFYSIYWTYKTAQRVDKMAAVKGVSSDMATFCLILAIFVVIIPPILLQDVMNKIATADDTQPVSNQKVTDVKEIKIGVADELKKFKELLDSGVITQEDFDAKKKQLLGL